jgi:hypothetical protein
MVSLRLTVQRQSIVVASVALALGLFLIVPRAFMYLVDTDRESYFLSGAADLEARNEKELAAEWRKMAAESRLMRQDSYMCAVTASCIFCLGLLTGGVRLLTWMFSTRRELPRSIRLLSSGSWLFLRVLLISAIISCVLYLCFVLVVLTSNE